jgi:flagellar hook-basal body complex protein FliE
VESISPIAKIGTPNLRELQPAFQMPDFLEEQKKGGSGQAPGDIIGNFGDMLKQQMDDLNHLSQNAQKAIETYASGGDIEVHNVVLALEKSGMAMQLAVQVRNKVLAAYQELNHMQI